MPGVIVTLVLVIIVNLTAFAIVREREAGTLEQTMVSPIRPAEFIFGKTVPFFFVGLSEVAVVVAGGLFWFQIPSTVCSTQQQAFSTNFFVLNPLYILSGLSFTISTMPEVLQWFTYINRCATTSLLSAQTS